MTASGSSTPSTPDGGAVGEPKKATHICPACGNECGDEFIREFPNAASLYAAGALSTWTNWCVRCGEEFYTRKPKRGTP